MGILELNYGWSDSRYFFYHKPIQYENLMNQMSMLKNKVSRIKRTLDGKGTFVYAILLKNQHFQRRKRTQ